MAEPTTYLKLTKEQLIEQLTEANVRMESLEAAQIENQKNTEELTKTFMKYRILIDESSDPIFSFASDGTYLYVNQAFAEGVKRTVGEIINKRIWDVFPQEEADKRFAAVKWVFENGMTKVIEVRVPRPDADRYYLTTVKPILDVQGKVEIVLCISKEITERKRMEEELRFLSTQDLLTGLYNRNFFEVELERLQKSRLFPVSIVVMDLDDLKTVNDLLGHTGGDVLIQKVAGCIRQTFRVEDIAARIGGDEFGVILPQVGESTARQTVRRLRTIIMKQKDDKLRISIGLATGNEGDDLHEVIRQADDRMYLEKTSHKKNQEDLVQKPK